MPTPTPAANDFAALLTTFADAVQTNRGQSLAMLFTEDGVYEDGFFGSHTGRSAPCCSGSTTPEAAISGSSAIRSATVPSAMPAFASATPHDCRKAWVVRSCSKGSAVSGFAAS